MAAVDSLEKAASFVYKGLSKGKIQLRKITKGCLMVVEERKEEELAERPEPVEAEEAEDAEPVEDDSKFDKIYSNVASNRYENLRTSYIENKAKELRKRKK